LNNPVKFFAFRVQTTKIWETVASPINSSENWPFESDHTNVLAILIIKFGEEYKSKKSIKPNEFRFLRPK
jgi:hypothetical protein